MSRSERKPRSEPTPEEWEWLEQRREAAYPTDTVKYFAGDREAQASAWSSVFDFCVQLGIYQHPRVLTDFDSGLERVLAFIKSLHDEREATLAACIALKDTFEASGFITVERENAVIAQAEAAIAKARG